MYVVQELFSHRRQATSSHVWEGFLNLCLILRKSVCDRFLLYR